MDVNWPDLRREMKTTADEFDNVVTLESLKRKKSLLDLEKRFKQYLSGLKQEQLQYESNFLINKMGEDGLSEEDLLRSALLMDELAKRMGTDRMSQTVVDFASNIRSKIDQTEH